MEQFLERLHAMIAEVQGELIMCIIKRRVYGGKSTLRKWSRVLKSAADLIDKEIGE